MGQIDVKFDRVIQKAVGKGAVGGHDQGVTYQRFTQPVREGFCGECPSSNRRHLNPEQYVRVAHDDAQLMMPEFLRK